jgi:hypothetical protein
MNELAASFPGWPPRIEFSDLREWHLDRAWERQSPDEEAIAFENVVFVIANYRRHGFTPVLVTDFREHRVADLVERFGDCVVIVSLVASDVVIRERVEARADGFTDADTAVAWNSRVKSSRLLSCERRYDTSATSVAELVDRVRAEIATRSA